MTNPIICELEWSEPRPRLELLKSSLAKAHYVYAITLGGPGDRSLIRIGASADLGKRLRRYPVLDFIPTAQVSWSQVSEITATNLKPLLRSHFGDEDGARPPHLEGKSLDYCIQRELDSIEYKVERLLLEEYRKRHDESLPPGNPRTGSWRAYLERVSVVEHGSVEVLDTPRAFLSSVQLSGAQLFRLLW